MNIGSLPKQPVACPMCSKGLSSRQNLRQHMNIHTGEKPYKCTHPACGQCFKHASQLSNHKSIHQQFHTVTISAFDDLRVFLRLIVQVFHSENFELRYPEFTKQEKKKIRLPLISSPQVDVKLPLFCKVSECNQNSF